MLKPFKGLVDDSAFIVVVVVIIGAFLLSGGQNMFQSDEETTATTPASTTSSAPPGSGFGPGASGWSITYTSKGCAATGEQIEITARGSGTGYITIEVKNGSDYQIVSSDEFKSSPSIWSPVTLLKSAGFATNPWRLKIFQGGSNSGGSWSGGTEKAAKDGVSTSCP